MQRRDATAWATRAVDGLATTAWHSTIERTVTGLDYELVDVERSAAGLLRVTIDRVPGHHYPGGEAESVTVEDCERVTRQLQYVLEVEAVPYQRLEVSSPGLDRPLKRPADYTRFAGHEVELTLKEPFNGRKNYRGTLLAADEGWRLALAGDKAASQRIVNNLIVTIAPVAILYYGYNEIADLVNLEQQALDLQTWAITTAWDILDPFQLLHNRGESGLPLSTTTPPAYPPTDPVNTL